LAILLILRQQPFDFLGEGIEGRNFGEKNGGLRHGLNKMFQAITLDKTQPRTCNKQTKISLELKFNLRLHNKEI
jgi:hypothetical protein